MSVRNHTAFHWYVQHKVTRYVVAGFRDYWEAEEFLKSRGHDEYHIRNFEDTHPIIPLNERHKLYDHKKGN